MTTEELIQWIRDHGPCDEEAITWAETCDDWAHVWASCARADWLLWVLAKNGDIDFSDEHNSVVDRYVDEGGTMPPEDMAAALEAMATIIRDRNERPVLM